jgi:hypothetical protein
MQKPKILTLAKCSYDDRSYRYVVWGNGGVLEVLVGVDSLGVERWERRDEAGYMASICALKELLSMQTTGTCPPLSGNTGKKKPKK